MRVTNCRLQYHGCTENGEGIQILHYEKGQKYEAHYDYFHDKFNNDPSKGGQRIATMLMYLYVTLHLLFRFEYSDSA